MEETLYKTEEFNGVQVHLYRNENELVLLTAEDIGKILGYAAPRPVIESIYKKNMAHINPYVKCSDKKKFFNPKGVIEICSHSSSRYAPYLRTYAWLLYEGARENELTAIITMLKNPGALRKIQGV
jgi:prophage antirepressor-like protein